MKAGTEAAPLRIVFMGTPDFAVPAVRALADSGDRLVAVVCQPDKPKGRGLKLVAPPVKDLACSVDVEVLQPEKLSDSDFLARLEAIAPDLIVVAAYGKILRRRTLDLPRLGCINIHASLLPKYRGAAPINWAIIRGETETGVTIMRMDEGMDTGPMLLVRRTAIGSDETAGELYARLSELGGEAIREAIARLKDGTLVETPQDDAGATLAPMMTREDGRIDWTRSPEQIRNLVRGTNPWPGSFTTLDGKILKVHRAARGDVDVAGLAPGTVRVERNRLLVAAGGGAVELLEVQLEGRKRLPVDCFLPGVSIAPGTRLGV